MARSQGPSALCAECGKALEGRDRDRSTCNECRSLRGKVAELEVAIRASGDSPDRLKEWPKIRHLLRQRYGVSLDDAELLQRCKDHLAAEGIPGEVYLKWRYDRFVAWLGESPIGSEKARVARRRGGRKKADFATEQKEAKLAADWQRARDAGRYKAEFAKERGMTGRQLDSLLDRVRKRKRPSE